jgi:hypothetical protein
MDNLIKIEKYAFISVVLRIKKSPPTMKRKRAIPEKKNQMSQKCGSLLKRSKINLIVMCTSL